MVGVQPASQRSQVTPFAVMEVLAAVAERRERGEEVYSLCAGEPGGAPPPVIRERAAELLAGGAGFTYTAPLGTNELRAAIAGHYERWYALEVDPRQVAVTTGSSGAFVLAFLAAFDAGAKVAVTRPGYPAYRNILQSLDCEVVDVPCGPETRYQPTPELLDRIVAESGPIDGLIIASPANPTGTMLSADELAAITAWSERNGVRLISDEIYHGITFEGERGSCAWATNRDAIVVSSCSKYWAMAGWRLGWALVPADLIAAVDALAGNLALCPPTLPQLAAVSAFTDEAYAFADAEVERYRGHRDLVMERVEALGWAGVVAPDGAFYVYADITKPIARAGVADSVEWCNRLLAETGVALTPGTDFDPVGGSHTVRLSFACGLDELVGGLDRLQSWCG